MTKPLRWRGSSLSSLASDSALAASPLMVCSSLATTGAARPHMWYYYSGDNFGRKELQLVSFYERDEKEPACVPAAEFCLFSCGLVCKTMGNVRNRFPIAILVRCPILLAGFAPASAA
eukprot:COSAG01_NODE_2125_length_8369_cov_17.028174_4_plen_118_part_00